MISDDEFGRLSAASLEALNRGLDRVADEHEVEILYQSGVLTLEIEEPTMSKILISPNSPARQVWISAQSTSFKLDWSSGQAMWLRSSTMPIVISRLPLRRFGAKSCQEKRLRMPPMRSGGFPRIRLTSTLFQKRV